MADSRSFLPLQSQVPLWRLLLLSAIAGAAVVSGLLFIGSSWLARLLFLGWRAAAAYQGQPLYFNLGQCNDPSVTAR